MSKQAHSNELTTAQKWAEVDYIINRIAQNRSNTKPAYEYPLDEYIEKHFSK